LSLLIQELTVELMAAKVELEAYVNGEHPYPEYLRHHISSCCETLEKQCNVEMCQPVADGFPQDVTKKDIHLPQSPTRINNGHIDTSPKCDTSPNATSGSIIRD